MFEVGIGAIVVVLVVFLLETGLQAIIDWLDGL